MKTQEKNAKLTSSLPRQNTLVRMHAIGNDLGENLAHVRMS